MTLKQSKQQVHSLSKQGVLTEEDVSSDRRKVEVCGETLQHKTEFFSYEKKTMEEPTGSWFAIGLRSAESGEWR